MFGEVNILGQENFIALSRLIDLHKVITTSFAMLSSLFVSKSQLLAIELSLLRTVDVARNKDTTLDAPRI